MAAASVQPAAAASQSRGSKPAVAAMDAHSRGAEAKPAPDECAPLHPHEQKVIAALLVVVGRAMKDGGDAVLFRKQVLISNMPPTSLFLLLLPDKGQLPSLKQLEGPVKGSPPLRKWLSLVAELCAAAKCQPLELFTRSAACTAHPLAATMRRFSNREFAARQQRLQAIMTCLGPAMAGGKISTTFF